MAGSVIWPGGAVVVTGYCVGMVKGLAWLGLNLPKNPGMMALVQYRESPWRLTGAALLRASFEEFDFRFGFLWAARWFGRRWLMVFMLIFSSVLFGLAHGGLSFVAIQGVGGLLLGLIYLKCGGWRGSTIMALSCSSLAHAVSNIGLVWLRVAI